jgi:DNA-binding NarL/FixJ family response regulator
MACAPLTILVVEDNRHMRRLLRELLQTAFHGSLVLEAADAHEALAHWRVATPHVVIMDVGLPDADGIELTTMIRLRFPETAVVVLSSHDGSAYRDAARSAGAAAYVAKVDVSTALVPAISDALRQQAKLGERA